MPILPAEPDLFPPDLLRDGPPAAVDGRAWWCLHARPRQEKATARHLRSRGLAHYLPMIDHRGRTPKGRAFRSVLPLFPGYLFLLGDDRERAEALRGNTLAAALAIPDQGQFGAQLAQIHRLLGSGLPVVPESRLPIGARCRIADGPLRGLVGTVLRRGGRDEFVAAVRFLGRGATITLSDWQVEPAPDHLVA